MMVLSSRMSVLCGDGWGIEGVGSVGWGGIHFQFEWGAERFYLVCRSLSRWA
jgi:hypothetical protein